MLTKRLGFLMHKLRNISAKSNVYHSVSFLAQTNIEKAQYKEAIERKNKEKKILKTYIKCKYNPSNEEIVAKFKERIRKTEFISTPTVSQITNTKMDQVINQEKKSDKTLQFKYVAQPKPKKTLYLTESQKDVLWKGVQKCKGHYGFTKQIKRFY